MGAAGAFYVQVFQYIDPGIAYGPHTSVEALVAAIVGGLGTLWGPVLGALVLHLLADFTRSLFGELPGINMVIYGAVLIAIVMFAPRGMLGSASRCAAVVAARRPRPPSPAAGGARG
jgi:branched-chain amino acid transport system permease protein